jgi:ribosomal protein S18 acetylase RimI-like enzyme
MGAYRVQRAAESDFDIVISLIDGVTQWLRSKGTDQWQKPWPSIEGRNARVKLSLSLGKTWIVWDGNDLPAATITTEDTANPKLWNEWESAVPAVYVHRLVVDRRHGGIGLGAALLNWTVNDAANGFRAEYIRVDVWTDNVALHRYYEDQGFERVYPDCADPEYPSRARFQRPVAYAGDDVDVILEIDPGRSRQPEPDWLWPARRAPSASWYRVKSPISCGTEL